MNIQAVIGANFGDCGKGVIVDYLSTPNTLVVRHNGGSQAGHTVTLPSGRQHTFHHFGAGTFQGANTLFGPHFICNPLQFLKERTSLGYTLRDGPTLYCDKQALITTPYDMILNQTMERQRKERHGSCGLGINETVTRSIDGPCIRVGDSERTLYDSLNMIRNHMADRATKLGYTLPSVFYNDTLLENFVDDTLVFFSFIQPCDASDILRAQSHIVFEGAQGLGLDEINGVYPHVTRSRTGLTNVVSMLDAAGLDDQGLTVHYVTRTYLTRHGVGPLADELPFHPFGWIGPETNEVNEWQGQFRYAPLGGVRERVEQDLLNAPYARTGLAVTCVDQLPTMTSGDKFCHDLVRLVGIPCHFQSYGPTRGTIVDNFRGCGVR